MVWFHPTDDMQPGNNANQLRPEVLESFFYMWRFTGDVKYQQWAWQIFQAHEKYSKVESGYAGLEVWQNINLLLCMLSDDAYTVGDMPEYPTARRACFQ